MTCLFFGQFPYERKPRIKNICAFYTHTDSQLVLVISMVALMVGTVVCVASRHVVVSVGGDHSWIDLSCHQRPSSNTHQLSIPNVFSPNGTGIFFSEDLHE